MIIAQLTDLHIGFDGPEAECTNTVRLEHVLKSIGAMRKQPDILLLTGDLIEDGAHWAYRNLKKALAPVKIPYYFAMGNHDNRNAFAKVFPEAQFNEGYLQYSIEEFPLRIIVLDTLGKGKHGGVFCEQRANWLSQELTKFADRPTLIALHHPPIETGIGWMTSNDDDAWVIRLKNIVSEHNQVVQIIGGHIHRSLFKAFANTHVSVSLAVAPQISLELAEIDPNKPDGRPLLIDGPAGYCLHHWSGRSLTTHSATAQEGQAKVSFDERHAFIVRHTLDLPPLD